MIELNDVCFAYPENAYPGRPVLEGVNLRVERGEYLGVIGDNGSGKTTLARLVNGLLLPTRGSVVVNGIATRDREGLFSIRRSVGIVFQNPDAQAIGETVEEDIVFGLENINVPKSGIDRRIDQYLGLFGIEDLRYQNISLLSGGQKQLVNIAAVMAMEPECIIFDEALSMMDHRNRANALETISGIAGRGVSVILITHDRDDLARCGRVVTISEGGLLPAPTPLPSLPPPILSRMSRMDECRECHEFREISSWKATMCAGIAVRQVSHTYDPGTEWAVPALDGIDFKIEAGEVFGILGGIGSGKSTLASLIAGLDTPTSGSITIAGMPPQPGKNVGILFQHPEDFFFEKTVREDMAFGLKAMGASNEAVERRIRSAIEAVGLKTQFLEESSSRLSSGEQRLISFASVIAMGPECIVLDEPTAGLDRRSRRKVLEVVRGMAGRKTVVYISHRVKDVLEISERVAVLEDGNPVVCNAKTMHPDQMQEQMRAGCRMGADEREGVWMDVDERVRCRWA